MLEAICWVQELGLGNVVVESDSMVTVQAIQKGVDNRLEVENILQDSRLLLSERSYIYVSFVRKQANRVAYLLARVSCEVNCFKYFCSRPHLVLKSIMYDALMI